MSKIIYIPNFIYSQEGIPYLLNAWQFIFNYDHPYSIHKHRDIGKFLRQTLYSYLIYG